VSNKKYQHKEVFGTEIIVNEDGTVDVDDLKDPCSGDSGGPLVWKSYEQRFVLIGGWSTRDLNVKCYIQEQ
jgi:secreted trypsin-like serine protease